MPPKHMRHYATLSHKKQLTNTKFKTSKQQTNSLSIFAYIVLLAPNFDYADFLETIEEIICSHIYLSQMHLINKNIRT